ncbi:hypothetical protein B0J13DRAFT_547494, partial [Dactylonectria estremocensis]
MISSLVLGVFFFFLNKNEQLRSSSIRLTDEWMTMGYWILTTVSIDLQRQGGLMFRRLAIYGRNTILKLTNHN